MDRSAHASQVSAFRPAMSSAVYFWNGCELSSVLADNGRLIARLGSAVTKNSERKPMRGRLLSMPQEMSCVFRSAFRPFYWVLRRALQYFRISKPGVAMQGIKSNHRAMPLTVGQ